MIHLDEVRPQYEFGGKPKPKKKEKKKQSVTYIGGNQAQSRQAFYNSYPEVVRATDSVANAYKINPRLLRTRLADEGYVDAGIRYNNSSRNTLDRAAVLRGLLYQTPQGYDPHIYGLDDGATMINNGQVKLINEKWDDADFTNENGRQTKMAVGVTPLDNIGIMAATLQTFRNQAKEDFPNATDDDLDVYANTYYNRGRVGGRSYIKRKGKTRKYSLLY